MTDIILELLRALLVGAALYALIRGRQSKEISGVGGWHPLIVGFALIFFGTLIDITDNFDSLSRFAVVGDTQLQAFLEKFIGYLVGFLLVALGIWRWLPKIIEHEARSQEELEEARVEVKTLSGLLPICASCKNIRDDKGYWNQIESYISEHSAVQFSHGLCPACMEKLYPDVYKSIQERKAQQAAPADG